MPTPNSLSNQAAVFWFILGFVFGVAVTVAIWPVLRKLVSKIGLQVSTPTGDRIDIDGAVAMLRDQMGHDRVESIREMYPSLPSDISGQDASELLNSLMGKNRVDALLILRPKLRTPLSDVEMELILNGLMGRDRTSAIKVLSQ